MAVAGLESRVLATHLYKQKVEAHKSPLAHHKSR